MFGKTCDFILSLLQYIDIGWYNGWWFTAIFGLANLFLIMIYGRAFAKRLFSFPKFQSLKERIISLSSVFLFARGLMVYTIFVPFKLGGVLFYIGTGIFILGLATHIMAMINFATTPPDKPVVKGIYQYSRHPMQILGIIMWVGVGLATISWIILLACVVQIFLCRPFLIAQERECTETYGEEYSKYMDSVSRYFLGFKPG
jgi:protein-S-isoprenylcysteine O-methyltransferase Ste14